jgi:hypothetical protein
MRFAEREIGGPQSEVRNSSAPGVFGDSGVIFDVLLPGEGSSAPERIASWTEIARTNGSRA